MFPNLTSTMWMMMMVVILIQSSMGMLLSLFSAWSYRVRLILIISETEASIYYWFTLTSLLINLFIFSSTIRMMTNLCSQMMRRDDDYQPIQPRSDMSAREITGYGAFGYRAVGSAWHFHNKDYKEPPLPSVILPSSTSISEALRKKGNILVFYPSLP